MAFEPITNQPVSGLTDIQKANIDSGLEKIGKTLGKMLAGVVSFAEKLGGALSPKIIDLAVVVLSRMGESFAVKLMKKNGVENLEL